MDFFKFCKYLYWNVKDYGFKVIGGACEYNQGKQILYFPYVCQNKIGY